MFATAVNALAHAAKMALVFVALHCSVSPMEATKAPGCTHLFLADCGTLQIFD